MEHPAPRDNHLFEANPARHRAGFTLIELLAVAAIIVILIILFLGVISRLPAAADRARCTANLRTLAVGFETYIQENGQWPQVPIYSQAQQVKWEEDWMKALKPYDVDESAWQCPAILRLGKIQEKGYSPKIHYSPTAFDDKAGTAHKWPTMPWLIEIADVHGHGPLLLLPDGSVHDYDTFVETLQK